MAYKSSSRTFNELVRLSGWQPEDGDYPGYWKHKHPGYRCLWSCNWTDDEGVIYGASIAPNDELPMQHELEDLAGRGDSWAAMLLQDGYEHNPKGWIVHLQEARQNYGDFYTYPFTAIGKMVHATRIRPGWPRL